MTRNMTPRAKASFLMLVCAIALPLFMLGGTFSHIFGLSLAVLVAFLVLGAMAGFSKGSLIALGCIMLIYCLNDLPVAFIGTFFSVLGVLSAVGILIAFGKYFYLFTIPVGYALALLICGDGVLALGTLLFLPPAVVLGFMVKKGCRQSNIVIGTTAAFVMLLAIAIAAWLFTQEGEFSLEPLFQILKKARDLLAAEMLIVATAGELPLTEEMLKETATLTMCLLPAALVLAFETIVYPAVRTVVGTCHRLGEKKPSPETMVLRLETVSAIVFFAAIVLAIFADGILMMVVDNLILLLTPAFLIVEVISLLAQLRLGVLRISPFLLLMLVFFAGSILPMFLAVLGALHTIFSNRARMR